ncbi:MAG: ABC transporter substrate-binding protein [Hyphomicrobiales bacterium]|nr:ABC transporter substrate-binding protein [Hyphomicrobiales bacterium]MDE2113671.1 ABC transporter substrate-binding protein [Hyphomicrobiales bacterium]
MSGNSKLNIRRRNLLQGGLVLGASQIASPFIMTARAEDTIKIGWDNPLTGTYAAPGKNELIGAKLALEEINAKGGIAGRKVEIIVEDSTSGDAGTAVQKARKLIDKDKVNFLIGNVNSALAIAMAQVSNEKGILHIVPGGHSDTMTGATCHWNVFRVCNTTQMEANAIAPTLIKTYGKKWYYITPDYAFGHALQSGMEKACTALGGTKIGGDLTPLGTTDFSSYLIKAQSANPDVIIFLVQGDDMVNALKQAVQFGLDKKVHLAGAQQELENLKGLPPEARVGNWVMEWYFDQPNVPHVADFNAKVVKASGYVPTSRTWFGYVGIWTCALAAAGAKSIDAAKMAKALQDFHLPPEIALCPDGAFYRAGQNQLISNLYVGKARVKGVKGPDDLFEVTSVVKGADVAGTLEESGCKMTWPA